MSKRQQNSHGKAPAVDRSTIPDTMKLFDLTPSASAANGLKPQGVNGTSISISNGNSTTNVASSGKGTGNHEQPDLSYETIDLEEITRRQLSEDILAYRYDLEFCTTQLTLPGLTPEETRTLQLRVLDLGHQIRQRQHRLEVIEASANQPQLCRPAAYSSYSRFPQAYRTTSTPSAGVKRPRMSKVKPSGSDNDEEITVATGPMSPNGDSTPSANLQRLGFWKCHLCTSQKFLMAGTNRVPSAPCKWPLKDISKMLNHFLDMHSEHSAEERCTELGAALAANRGPLEYWLTRTRQVNLKDGNLMNEIVDTLQAGELPHALRNLNRAAAAFPNAAPEAHE